MQYPRALLQYRSMDQEKESTDICDALQRIQGFGPELAPQVVECLNSFVTTKAELFTSNPETENLTEIQRVGWLLIVLINNHKNLPIQREFGVHTMILKPRAPLRAILNKQFLVNNPDEYLAKWLNHQLVPAILNSELFPDLRLEPNDSQLIEQLLIARHILRSPSSM